MIGIMSPKFCHCKIPWKICIYRNDHWFGFYFRPVGKILPKCAYDKKLTLKLISFNTQQDAYTVPYSEKLTSIDMRSFARNS